jgi:hypothetical protein
MAENERVVSVENGTDLVLVLSRTIFCKIDKMPEFT